MSNLVNVVGGNYQKLPPIEVGELFSPSEKLILLEEQLRAEKVKVERIEKEVGTLLGRLAQKEGEYKTLLADFTLLTETLKTTKEELKEMTLSVHEEGDIVAELLDNKEKQNSELERAKTIIFRLVSRITELEDGVKKPTKKGG